VVWFFINLYHLKFASQIQRAIKFSDQKAFENAWENLRNHFRIYGILTCVLILLYLVLVVAVVKTAASDFSPMI
jgi:predicted PurR-regulated permease PerM